LSAGTIYEFKVRARNQYDYSSDSSTLSHLCAYIPEIPTDITTDILNSQMKVSWTLPSANGSPITAYKVFILEIGTTTFTLEDNDCVSGDETVIANRECFVEISTLLAAPYNVDGGDSISAKVVAVNVYGETD
jgi:hypothetical protein